MKKLNADNVVTETKSANKLRERSRFGIKWDKIFVYIFTFIYQLKQRKQKSHYKGCHLVKKPQSPPLDWRFVHGVPRPWPYDSPLLTVWGPLQKY